MLTDDLVSRAQRGDSAAFTKLFRQYRRAVERVAFRMLGQSADAEDAVQDVFIQVHRSLPNYRAESKFSSWLHRVAVNVMLMARRSARRCPVLVDDEWLVADERTRPDYEAAVRRRVAAFQRLVEQLTETQRRAYLLHEFDGVGFAELALRFGCPVLTVRTRLFRARKGLLEAMRYEPALAELA